MFKNDNLKKIGGKICFYASGKGAFLMFWAFSFGGIC